MASLHAKEQPRPEPFPETGHDILCQRLPKILQHKDNKTTSEALHGLKFKGQLGRWESFEQEVSQFWTHAKIPNHILSYRPKPYPGEIYLGNEQVVCGDELSVSGRFTQNVLHPVTAVASLMGLNSQFGDFKICQEAHRALDKTQAFRNPSGPPSDEPSKKNGAKIPDYVAVDKSASLRFLGEAKTPWKHSLDDYIDKYYGSSTSAGRSSLEKAFGQIADYMYAFDLKYAFLTTYDQTIFLKQEKVDGTWRLFFSNPIYSYTGVLTHPSQGKEKHGLTVRQCMLWLCHVTSGPRANFVAENGIPEESWINSDKVTFSQLASPWRKVLRTGDTAFSPLKNRLDQQCALQGGPQTGMLGSHNPYGQDDTPSRPSRKTALPLHPGGPITYPSQPALPCHTPPHPNVSGYSTPTSHSRSGSPHESQGYQGSRSRHRTPPPLAGRPQPQRETSQEAPRRYQQSTDRESRARPKPKEEKDKKDNSGSNRISDGITLHAGSFTLIT